MSHRKYTPDWRALSAKRSTVSSSSKTCSEESNNREGHVSFGAPFVYPNDKHYERKPVVKYVDERNQLPLGQLRSMAQIPSSSNFPISQGPDANEFFAYGNWDDELRSVIEFALDPSPM